MHGEAVDDHRFEVVVNDLGQYSIQSADREPSAGWHTTGHRGTREECLAEVCRVWTDLRTAAAPWPGTTVIQRFSEQARNTPDAIALIGGDHAISYAELDRAVGATAAALRGAGAGPGSLIGICLERGVPLVVAMLATWRAGAAILPVTAVEPVIGCRGSTGREQFHHPSGLGTGPCRTVSRSAAGTPRCWSRSCGCGPPRLSAGRR